VGGLHGEAAGLSRAARHLIGSFGTLEEVAEAIDQALDDVATDLDSLTIIEFYEASNEIGFDQLQRRPTDSSDSWFVHHGKPAE
jgi:phage-related tail protein